MRIRQVRETGSFLLVVAPVVDGEKEREKMQSFRLGMADGSGFVSILEERRRAGGEALCALACNSHHCTSQ